MIEFFGEREMIELSNQADASVSVINSTRIAAAIAQASSLVDSYLHNQYDLPIPDTEIPYCLKTQTASIARYFLDRETRYREGVRLDFEDAIAWLGKIASGKIGLGINPLLQQESKPTSTINFTRRDRIFSEDTLHGF